MRPEQIRCDISFFFFSKTRVTPACSAASNTVWRLSGLWKKYYFRTFFIPKLTVPPFPPVPVYLTRPLIRMLYVGCEDVTYPSYYLQTVTMTTPNPNPISFYSYRYTYVHRGMNMTVSISVLSFFYLLVILTVWFYFLWLLLFLIYVFFVCFFFFIFFNIYF